MKGIIYIATSQTTQKSYIGLTTRTLNKRKITHLSEAKRNSQTHFHRAIRKYGEGDFKWKTIRDGFTNKVSLECAEIFYISRYNTFYDGYNMVKGGASRLGIKVSKAQIAKQKKTLGVVQDSGLTLAQEIGKKSGETKRRTGCVAGEKNHFFGKAHNSHTLQKMRKPKSTTINMKKTDETKQKMSDAQIGKSKSSEHILNMKLAKQKETIRTCLHCGLQGKGGNMTRYHFDNCKKKDNK